MGYLLAVVASLCSAASAVLQSVGARGMTAHRPGPRLLWQLARSGPYAAGLALDGASSGLAFVALRSVPLFAVQAVTASSLGAVALLATCFLRARLRRLEWLAIGALVAGLVLLVGSARTGPPAHVQPGLPWLLLGIAVAATTAVIVAGRRLRGAALPAILAGLCFGLGAASARLIGSVELRPLALANPAFAAAVLAGLTGTLLYATSLRAGALTRTTSLTVVVQTLVPAVIGRVSSSSPWAALSWPWSARSAWPATGDPPAPPPRQPPAPTWSTDPPSPSRPSPYPYPTNPTCSLPRPPAEPEPPQEPRSCPPSVLAVPPSTEDAQGPRDGFALRIGARRVR
jgi:drug/metabolite transporter (DMT)-like permease